MAVPLYGGLASGRFPAAKITVLADSSGSYPDVPDLDARLAAALGADEAIHGLTGKADGLAEPRIFPGLTVLNGLSQQEKRSSAETGDRSGDRDVDREARSGADSALHGDVAAHGLGQLLDEGEAKARALLIPLARWAASVEAVPDPRQVLAFNARAIVLDLDNDVLLGPDRR